MESQSGSGKKSGSDHSGDAGGKDRLIVELKDRIAVLENGLRSKQDAASSDIADSKLVEKALRAGEERYRSLLESTGDWVWETDEDFVLTYDSPMGRKILGYGPDEVIGRTPFSLMPEDELERIKLIAWPAIARHEAIQRIENRLIKKDGSIATIETSAIPLFDESGHYRGYRGVNHDITERKQVNEKLAEKERFLSNIFECIQDGISILDKDLNIIQVNPVMEKRYGGHIVGKKCFQAYHGRSEPCEICPSIRAIKTGTTQTGIVYDLDGWSEIYAFPLINDRGEVTGVIEHVRDINERMQAEEAREKSESDLKRAQSIAHLGNWEWDLMTDQLSGSEEYYRMFGIDDPKPAPFEKFASMLHPDDRKWVDEAIKDIHFRDLPHSTDFRLLLPDGNVKFIHSEVEATYDSNGRPVKIFGTMQDITERKHVEEALRESEEKYRFLVENSRDLIWKIDLEGRWTFVGGNVQGVTGYRPEEMMGKTIWDFLVPECHGSIREKLLKRMRGEDITPYTTWIINKAGDRISLEVATTAIIDEDGKVVGVQGISRDITQRMRAENAARLANAYNRSLIEASLDPLVTISPDGKITDVNKATEVATGIHRDKLIGTDFSNYFTDPDMARNGYKRVFEAGSVNDYPLELRNRDGRIIPVLYNATIYRDESGKVIGVFAAARDITERKHVEEALRESEKKFRVLAETSPAAIFLYQGEKYVYVNPMAEILTGYSRDELLSRDAWEWIHPEFLELVKDRARRRQMGEELPSQYEVKYRARGGRDGWVDFTAGLIDYEGKPAGLAMAFDVTKRKQAEEALKETKAQAELYVDLMGHDINNMNQVSMGFLELAHNIIEMDGRLGEDNIVLLDKAINSLNNSSQLIANVRKLQRERMGLYEDEVIDVDDMVEDVTRQFHSIPGRDVKIVFTTKGHCRVRANSLLKDVFINLVGNAVKHSNGALTVNIYVDQVTDNGMKYCRVAVEDDGPGIPDGLKETLFDRLNLSTTRARGKGFGLCLIKMLVDDYNGKFWVEDRVQGDHTKGARFIVMLPAVGK